MSPTSANNPSESRREAALRFLANRINYERAQSMPCSEEAFKLDRMRELLRRLGNPERDLPIIHVAGTKGKGSTAAMIAAVLSAAGYRTGLFTSPHLDRIEERIALDGQPCSGDELADAIEQIRPAVEAMDHEAEMGPTYFEILTAAALWHFKHCNADAVVLEVGLGGRLDSTNVCTPRLSVITSISFDHVRQLGPTLADIAGEKAGIIKPGVPVVSGVRNDEPREVVRRIARENDCPLVELGIDFDYTYHAPQHLERVAVFGQLDYFTPSPRSEAAASERIAGVPKLELGKQMGDLSNVAIGLLGRHQGANAALAMAAVGELRRGGWAIPEVAVRRGLAELTWPARIEVVARRPAVVLDAAHNAASIAALVEVLAESFSVRRRILVFATTQDKDIDGMLRHLAGRFDTFIFTRYLNNPRSVPPENLQKKGSELFSSPLPAPTGAWSGDAAGEHRIHVAPTPAEAWEAVRGLATPDDLVCITGSFFFAAEMREQITLRPMG